MPNAPTQPPDPPAEGASPAANAPRQGRHGIPHDMHEHEASGTPDNDRQASETAAMKQDQS